MDNDKVVYLTQEGLNRLQAELEVLRNKRRPEVAERIRQAKEFGDINENAEYDDAKNEQGFVEGRILLLEKLVRNASIIEGKHVKGIVEVGSTVKVHDEYGDEAFTIVGSAEAEPSKGRISLESPVGKALLGKHVGDDVSLMTPGVLLSLGMSLWWKLLGLNVALYPSGLGVQVVWALPFGFLVMLAIFNRYDVAVEEAARDLGASALQTFTRVTLPIIWGGVFGAASASAVLLKLDAHEVRYALSYTAQQAAGLYTMHRETEPEVRVVI